jgi:phosphohistidine phosphatase
MRLSRNALSLPTGVSEIMLLVFLRHGPAGHADASRWPDDRERPLTTRGSDRTRVAAKGLARLVGPIDRVWTSPLARAHATADLLVKATAPPPAIDLVEELAPGGRALPLVREWVRRAQGETLVLVGHEPALSDLAATVSGLKTGGLALKKAGALAITIDAGAPATSGQLLWLLPPRVLRALPRGRKVET